MKIRSNRLARILVIVALLVPTGAAWAQWELDGTKSAVNFISIKNDSVAETHSFTSLVGYIGEDGTVQLSIGLDSVETPIEVRNDRMREMLFETVKFPAATVSATVAPDMLAAVAGGGTVTTELALKLELHGVEKSITVPVVVVGERAGHIQVFTPSPVIINAADFNLAAGVAALQSVAGLNAISAAVPVTVHLVFTSVK